jgi:hypothetical protein
MKSHAKVLNCLDRFTTVTRDNFLTNLIDDKHMMLTVDVYRGRRGRFDCLFRIG